LSAKRPALDPITPWGHPEFVKVSSPRPLILDPRSWILDAERIGKGEEYRRQETEVRRQNGKKDAGCRSPDNGSLILDVGKTGQ